MSFNYPADFDNVSYSVINSSNSSMELIGKLENSARFKVQTIWVDKNISAISPAEARDKLISVVKNLSKGEIVSTTSETNPNGVVVEKIIFTDEDSGSRERYCRMFFKINDSVYGIMIYGGKDTADKQKVIDNTANIIFQSIK